ncbi:MAG: MoaD/ThiS family protein [Verrucomicrobiales bacterium]|nr:MoaD/ThiS family protein [Verrucomicrobiales bacterium]MCP5527648.1 MoaD/ThiS family protein [Verrucomicrobiales bacterium]
MRILFFAQLKDATGREEIRWPETGPLTAADIWARLEREWPAVTVHRRTTRLARNGEYARPDEVFLAGDEVALIPPVSGG